MSEFSVGQEPPRLPAGMKTIGKGVIASCLLLSLLFIVGIYINLISDPLRRGARTGPMEIEGVTIEDGLLTHTNSPGFSIEIPRAMDYRRLLPGQVYSGAQSWSPFSFQVTVSDLDEESLEAWVETAGNEWVSTFEGLGSESVEIVRTEPTDMYAGFQAFEMEIKWLWIDDETKFININHYILKDNKVITLSATVSLDLSDATSIYKTIDLSVESDEIDPDADEEELENDDKI